MPPKKRKAPSEDTNVVYKVYCDEDYTTSWDTAWHHQSESDMLQGTYSTLREANAAAKQHLLNEWSRDCFEKYDVTEDDDGLVTVNAIFEEGETFTVRVVKVGAEAIPPQEQGSGEVFVVVKTVFVGDDFENPAGKDIWGVFQSMAGAGKAVERYLVDKKDALPEGIKKKKKKDGSVIGFVKKGRKDVVVLGIDQWDVKN